MTDPTAAPIPAEWAPHRAMWVGWPSHAEYWFEALEQARDEVEGLVRALAGPGREQVRLMVGKADIMAEVQARFAGVENVEVVAGTFGDIWLRDTGPIFGAGSKTAAAFRFNGWGGKYDMPGDDLGGRPDRRAFGHAPDLERLRHGGRLAGSRRGGDGSDHAPVPAEPPTAIRPGTRTRPSRRRPWNRRWGPRRCCGWATVC